MKKKCRIILNVFFVPFFIVIGFMFKAEAQNDNVNGKWSGTLTEHSQFTGPPGIIASESRVTITFTNNIGNGTYTETGEMWAEGKLIGKIVCNGSGPARFSEVSIDKTNGKYTIQAAGLMYSCTHSGPGGTDTDTDPSEAVVTIAEEPWNNNPRVLSGSRVLVTESPGGGKLTTTTTWNLVKQSDVELIVIPQNYDRWLPIPGKDEQRPGPEMMSVTLKLQDRNGGPASEKAKAFELHLSNTSKEPGVTINFPTAPWNDPLPDLRFYPQTNAIITEEGQKMKIYCPTGCLSASLKIACYDGGAWTSLTAIAVLETDTIKGKLLQPAGEEDILIPKRKPGAKIATAWLNVNGNPNEIDDKETSIGNTNNGDGLTAYEEYRGVISEEKFKRLKPDKKELGIKIKRAEISLFTEAFQWLENASELKIIRFYENEIARDRRLNKNALSAHDYDQYVLRVEKRNLPEGIIGTAYNGPGIPAVVDPVVFDWTQIQVGYRDYVNLARPDPLRFTLRDMLAWCVTHEIGHAINIRHHGQDLKEPDRDITDTSGIYRIFDWRGNVIRDRPWLLRAVGSSRGTVESGDLSCALAYNPYYLWGYSIGVDGAHIYNQVPFMPVGKKLCNSKDGTGINSTNIYFGEAARGNCLSQLKLR